MRALRPLMAYLRRFRPFGQAMHEMRKTKIGFSYQVKSFIHNSLFTIEFSKPPRGMRSATYPIDASLCCIAAALGGTQLTCYNRVDKAQTDQGQEEAKGQFQMPPRQAMRQFHPHIRSQNCGWHKQDYPQKRDISDGIHR